ncbi:fumarylacetoacetate hydrolase family protein [Salipaludibacillus daqingensis]|uniref:fumarylacetoacetate hydrolase family protein n=1 Tax=Salipaludibacillus daqingensis TaxID=3041001 RepID=UPI002473E3CB|nr:fumarylacetoacetate hydrolase family protein [Salipaludibacillus daqingensis]
MKNIYCVGRNYKKHADELGNAVPDYPMIFSKPSHSLVKAKGQEIKLPSNSGRIDYEVELVFQLNRSYEKGMSANDCISQMAVGVDFTLREVQNELKKKGHPWLLAKGFPNAALVTDFFPFLGMDKVHGSTFTLDINGNQVQKGDPKQMIFSLDVLLDYFHDHVGLAAGDLLFTGTPEGVGEVHNGDKLEMFFNEDFKGRAIISS